MGHELVKLVLEVCAVVGAIAIVYALLRLRVGRGIGAAATAVPVVALFVVVLAVSDIGSASSALNDARRESVGAQAGLAHCFSETNGEPGPMLPSRLPFVRWVKRQLPSDAVYSLAPSVGPPDQWCVALVMLPALPAREGQRAGWLMTFGTLPAGFRAWTAQHARSVRVFAPGFELVQVRG